MRGGFRRQVNPGSLVSGVDLEATRSARVRLHREVRLRQHLAWLMEHSVPGSDIVTITPFELVPGPGHSDDLQGAAG